MKTLSLAAAIALALPFSALSSDTALANEPFCFMETSTRVTNLTGLCAPSPNAVTISEVSIPTPPESLPAPAPAPSPTQEYLRGAASTSAFVYGDAYCEARAQGRTHRQASSAARSVTFRALSGLGLSGYTPDNQWFANAHSISQELCPELQPAGRYT